MPNESGKIFDIGAKEITLAASKITKILPYQDTDNMVVIKYELDMGDLKFFEISTSPSEDSVQMYDNGEVQLYVRIKD